MELLWWLIAIVLMAVGLLGSDECGHARLLRAVDADHDGIPDVYEEDEAREGERR